MHTSRSCRGLWPRPRLFMVFWPMLDYFWYSVVTFGKNDFRERRKKKVNFYVMLSLDILV